MEHSITFAVIILETDDESCYMISLTVMFLHSAIFDGSWILTVVATNFI